MHQYQPRLGYFLLHYLHTVARLVARITNCLAQVEQGHSDSALDTGEIMIVEDRSKIHRAQTALCTIHHVEYCCRIALHGLPYTYSYQHTMYMLMALETLIPQIK